MCRVTLNSFEIRKPTPPPRPTGRGGGGGIGSLTGYLDVLMYVPIVYGVLPEINVFVFVMMS